MLGGETTIHSSDGGTSPAVDQPAGPNREPVHWRRNVFVLWFSVLITITGFGFTTPFIPLFLARDLGVHDPHALALWTGLVAGALGAGLFLASPIWGMLADRFGRKPMLIRAMVCGGVMIILTGFARGPVDATVYRFLYGALSGPVAISIAMVSIQTPRAHVGWAIGLVSSASSLASAIGPAAGGLAASVLELRQVFVVGGVLFLLGVVPVVLVLKESRPTRAVGPTDSGVLEVIRSMDRRTLRALGVLVACQVMLSAALSLTQPMVVLRLLELDAKHAAALTGLLFSSSGVATAAAAATYSYFATRRGYRFVAFAAAAFYSVALTLVALASSIGVLIGAFVLVGLMTGVLTPAISTMLGLESPTNARATVFGIAASGLALGILIGPLTGGFVSAAAGPSAAILLAAGLLVVLGVTIALSVREPSMEVGDSLKG